MIAIDSMTKKQKSVFKKLCSIHGSNYVSRVLNHGKTEQKDFVLKIAEMQGVWYVPGNLQDCSKIDESEISISALLERIFEIPSSWYDRSRGQNQKRSYRMNRLQETFSGYNLRDTLQSQKVGKQLLFSMDLSSINKLMAYNSRWYMPANSAGEALAIFQTMVLMPLGVTTPGDHPDHDRAADIKCHGLAEWFDYNKVNAAMPDESSVLHKMKKTELTSSLEKLEEAKINLDMTYAILNQLRTFVDD